MLIINLLLLLINKSYINLINILLFNNIIYILYFIVYKYLYIIQYKQIQIQYKPNQPTLNLTYPPPLQPPLILTLCNSYKTSYQKQISYQKNRDSLESFIL